MNLVESLAGIFGANEQKSNIRRAADSRFNFAQKGIDEQRGSYSDISNLFSPYVKAGDAALQEQLSLLGLLGDGSEESAIGSVMSSPTFQSMLDTGERGILSNASATGGLRGGDVQEALAMFSPALLSSLIEKRFSQLGGLSAMGQNSAGQQAGYRSSAGSNITNLLDLQGSSQAGKYMGYNKADEGIFKSLSSLLGGGDGSGASGSIFKLMGLPF